MQNEIIGEVFDIIDYQLESLNLIKSPSQATLSPWRTRTIRLLTGLIVPEELRILERLSEPSYTKDKASFEHFLLNLKRDIQKFPEMYLVQNAVSSKPKTQAPPQFLPRERTISSRKVFIVHGHDNLAKLDVARTVEKLGLEAIILHEQPNQGRTLIEKFEENASLVGFAIIILTPDDIGYPKDKPDPDNFRARQNVVLELGYFSGLISRRRLSVLYKGKVEIPSDYLGIVYTELDNAGAWKMKLAKEMKLAGLKVDLNSL